MNHFTQSVISSAIASAVLWAACASNAAHAQSAQDAYNSAAMSAASSTSTQPAHVTPAQGNTPPDYDKTSQAGSLLNKGQHNMNGWRNKLTGELTNYNTYTPKKNISDQVVAILKNCKDSSGHKSYGCDFTQLNSGGEVRVDSLLGPAGYSDDPARAAAFNFVIQTTNPSPYGYPGDDKIFKDPKNKSKGLTDDGVVYFGNILKQLPGLSIPQFVMLALFSDRERQPGLGGQLPVGDGKGSASVLEMLEYEATRRYTNPNWFAAMGSATDQAVVREIAYELAFQNFMLVKQYEQDQRTQALLISLLSAMNNMNTSANNPDMQKDIEKKASQAS